MDKCAISPFSTEIGERVYKIAEKTVDEYSMYRQLDRGVIVGLSGGKDSVALLYFLLELRRRRTYFNIVAVHINHMIRGAEADRDESFARTLAESLGVECITVKADVPTLAKELSIGTEEAARRVRYAEFNRILAMRSDVAAIAVAHNATDNLETVIFNMFRGSGASGAAGIRPVRDNIIRPLIDVDQSMILELLDTAGAEYVVDSTNLESAYTRNFIRHNVVEQIRKFSNNPEKSVMRLSRHLRLDDDYISSVADDFLNSHDVLYSSDLLGLHDAVFARLMLKFAAERNSSLEEVHILNIRRLLDDGDFSLSIPNNLRFVCERGVCKIIDDVKDDVAFSVELNEGITSLNGFDADVYLYRKGYKENYPNIYKNAIHADLSSAIIVGRLCFRSRKDGDTIYYSSHTHKLRKIFNDFKIPLSERKDVLILCDDKGVVWIPGLAVRDDGACASEDYEIELLLGGADGDFSKRVRTVSEYRINARRKENNK